MLTLTSRVDCNITCKICGSPLVVESNFTHIPEPHLRIKVFPCNCQETPDKLHIFCGVCGKRLISDGKIVERCEGFPFVLAEPCEDCTQRNSEVKDD